jgi:hypothetical protein
MPALPLVSTTTLRALSNHLFLGVGPPPAHTSTWASTSLLTTCDPSSFLSLLTGAFGAGSEERERASCLNSEMRSEARVEEERSVLMKEEDEGWEGGGEEGEAKELEVEEKGGRV